MRPPVSVAPVCVGGLLDAENRLRVTMSAMRYRVLAVDYDDTLATHGRVPPPVIAALVHTKKTGRCLVLVSGRQVDDLLQVFSAIGIFERVVAENGAVIYTPETRKRLMLASPPSAAFTERLAEKRVLPLSIGQSIVATTRAHEMAVQRTIDEMGLELHVIFNGDSLMILPPDIDKASGLASALYQLGLSPRQTVGVGNAENDFSLLAACGYGIAVANAVPSLKRMAAYVTHAEAGDGVIEVVELFLAGDR